MARFNLGSLSLDSSRYINPRACLPSAGPHLCGIRWSGYHGEWGGLGEGDNWYYVGGGTEKEVYAGEGGVRREAGFSTFHIRRGDFQYKEVGVG